MTSPFRVASFGEKVHCGSAKNTIVIIHYSATLKNIIALCATFLAVIEQPTVERIYAAKHPDYLLEGRVKPFLLQGRVENIFSGHVRGFSSATKDGEGLDDNFWIWSVVLNIYYEVSLGPSKCHLMEI